MGWFEEQVKARKELDAKTFEDSFLSLAGIRSDKTAGLSDEAVRENFTISQILSHFRHPDVDMPANIAGFEDKLRYALGQYDIQYRKVLLDESYAADGTSPLLIFTLVNNIPVVLFPWGSDQYYYINYKTGKKVFVKAANIHRLELEAYSFYRLLPSGGTSVKEYWGYLRKCIRPLDIVLLVVFAALAGGVGLLLPFLTKTITGDVVKSGDVNQWTTISLYLVAAATGLVLIAAIRGYVNTRISLKVEKSVTQATMMRVLSLPTSFFKKYSTGELSARFRSIPALANALIGGILVTLVSVVMSLAYLFQLIGFAPVLILPVVLVLLLSTGFSVVVAVFARRYKKKELMLSSKESGVAYEMINGIQKIRLSGSEKRVFAKWANVYSKSARVKYNPPLFLRLSPAISLLITLAGSIAFYYLAASQGIDAGSYMAFIASYGVLSAAFSSLVSMVEVIFSISPLYEIARPILEAKTESAADKTVLPSVSGNVRMENVSFRYGEGDPLVIDGLDLEVKEGEYVAIVGATGCGKSTLVRLLLGFEKPTAGRVYFDGHDLDSLDLRSLRQHIGTVLQNGSLFHADIYSNIIISNPSLREKDAWEAAEIANIADEIKAMPMGMKTIISEGQGGISGGQKQRILIARSVVHKPKVLVFDEATSALDNKTQASVSECIGKLHCTRIVIAHRLSTIRNADRIIMLEGGKIIEEGNYQSLIDRGGKFAELVERQRLDRE